MTSPLNLLTAFTRGALLGLGALMLAVFLIASLWLIAEVFYLGIFRGY